MRIEAKGIIGEDFQCDKCGLIKKTSPLWFGNVEYDYPEDYEDEKKRGFFADSKTPPKDIPPITPTSTPTPTPKPQPKSTKNYSQYSKQLHKITDGTKVTYEKHTFDAINGKCKYCYYECKHSSWKSGVCTTCKFKCQHEFNYSPNIGGKCKICGEKHTECERNIKLTYRINGKKDTHVVTKLCKVCGKRIGEMSNGRHDLIVYKDYGMDGKDFKCQNCGIFYLDRSVFPYKEKDRKGYRLPDEYEPL